MNFINIWIILLIFLLPYIWFWDKLYIWWDDTRLFYSYPFERLKNIAWSSWFHFSGYGTNSSQYFIMPLLLVLSFLRIFIADFILQNFCISSIFILWFFYSKKYLDYIGWWDNHRLSMICSFIYISSPILYFNQINSFLYCIRLVALIPFILYNWALYINEWRKTNLLYSILWLICFSLAVFSIPWLLWFLLPFSIIYLIYICINYKIFSFKRLFIFLWLWLLSQIFWLLPFATQFIYKWSSWWSDVLSKETSDTFTPTVKSTSYGNWIIDPMTNNFHRKIQQNFSWESNKIQKNWYDRVYYISFAYIFIILIWLFYSSKIDKKNQQLYYLSFVWFLISLFLFTVKIWVLEQVFLSFGKIPWFVMFRNFFDKFSLWYLLFFVCIIYQSMIIIKKNNIYIYNILLYVILWLSIYTSIPLLKGTLLNVPLRTTQNIKRNMNIPNEYFDFLKKVKDKLSPTQSIFILPYGISSYSYIQWNNSNEYFIWRSPIELFIWINDYSWRLSFRAKVAQNIENEIKASNYKKIFKILDQYNVKYIINFPKLNSELLKSYLFDQELSLYQSWMVNNKLVKKILTSKSWNYELYKINYKNNWIFESNQILSFEKKRSYYYNLRFNLKNNQLLKLLFKDSFHSQRKLYPGKPITHCPTTQVYNTYTETGSYITWTIHIVTPQQTLYTIAKSYRLKSDYIYDLNKLTTAKLTSWQTLQIVPESYPQILQTATGNITECTQSGYTFWQWEELSYLWRKPLWDDNHSMIYDYANWRNISLTGGDGQNLLDQGLSDWRITRNIDGSYDVSLVLYFRPQSRFYVWLGVSGTTFLALLMWLAISSFRKKENSLE